MLSVYLNNSKSIDKSPIELYNEHMHKMHKYQGGDPMELKKIQYFLRIVDEGSLSKAAQSLYLTQPSLSRFLEKLEDEVGVALFTRSKNNSLVLTEEGRAYLRTARKIDALWRELDAELAPGRKTDGPLTFGIHGDYLLPFAAECAEKVRQRFPEVSVSYFSDSAPEIQRLVAEGSIRMGLCAFEKKDPRLVYVPCGKVEMNLVVSNKHPLAAHSHQLPGQENHRLSLSQLGENAAFAMMRGNTVLRLTVENYLSKQKYVPNIKQTYQRHGSIGEVVGGSGLIGFCPADNISPRLAYIALDPPMYYTRGVCWLQKTTLNPAEKLLVNLLKKMPTQRELK